jgi:penicillin G amidase
VREEQYIVRETHRGPIIHYIFSCFGSFDMQNDTLSVAWTGFNSEWKTYTSFLRGFLITNFTDLRNYLQYDSQTFYNVNLLCITADNHIVLQQSGLQPIRRNCDSGNYVKNGNTSEHDWVGIVPPQDRMHIFDPPKGYIVTGNNRLAEGGFYGGYLNYTTFTGRGDRLTELVKAEVESGRKIGKAFMKKLLYDTVDIYCRRILPEILAVVNEAQPLLATFDCNFSSISFGASLYEVFMY